MPQTKSVLYNPCKRKLYDLTKLFVGGIESVLISKVASESCLSLGLAKLEDLYVDGKTANNQLLQGIISKDFFVIYKKETDAFFIGSSLKHIKIYSVKGNQREEHNIKARENKFHQLKNFDRFFVGEDGPFVFTKILNGGE